ncbi:cytochrome C [Bremerella cremea]|uniref:Cytochrome C n=1 Tax=Blastopirellula marina TaxID=124 RepID=A0A2S8F8T1_9BACT|nr:MULTISPECIES: PVC-type heme-binding CxxCH protein [Pirellulaceae]PQO28573.1 cytochrome C [Blastopirellula marina]RCS41944.1 cytochrome C [Bremerella cremea]
MIAFRFHLLSLVCLLGSTLVAAHATAEEHDYAEQLKPVPGVSATKALETFKLAPGFRMEMAASEPNVVDPVAMAFDADGRMFIIEMRGYSEDDGLSLGRVRLLEDADNDGIYEKSTVFAEGFSWPTAITCTRGGVLVGAAPDIFFLQDTDGDGQADEKRVVFTGFGKSNVQGLMNTFKWGLDNRIHGVTSSSGANVQKVVEGEPTGDPLSLRGRDFSIDPLTMDLQPISGGGQHGMSFNDWGEKFTCSNSDHLQQVIYEDAYLARNPYVSAPSPRRSIAEDGPQAEVYRTSPVEAWRVIRTKLRAAKIVPGIVEGGGRPAGYFTGATGVTIFRGDAWPKKYDGYAIIGDVGSNLVHRKKLVDDGILYRGVRVDEKSEFLSSSDIWFRPVQYANAPDGSLYVADMYREVIEHPKSLPEMIKKHLDLTSGRDRGRIYRIVADEFERTPLPKLSGFQTKNLVAMLDHPNAWQRETAARLIYERQDQAAVPELEAFLTQTQSPQGTIAALHALAGLKQLKAQHLLPALADVTPHVRRHATALSEPLLARSPELREKVISLAKDESPKVRFQLAFTAGYLPAEHRTATLAKLTATDGNDPYFQAAIQSSVGEGAGRLLAALVNSPEAKSVKVQPLITALATQIGKQQNKADIAVLLGMLPALADSDPAMFEKIVRSLNLPSGDLVAQQLAKATEGKSTKVFDRIVSNAQAVLKKDESSLRAKVEAVNALRYGNFDRSLFEDLLAPSSPLEVQSQAIVVLGSFDAPKVAELLIAKWPEMSPQLRPTALDSLASRDAWRTKLLEAIHDKSIPTADLSANQTAQLASLMTEDQAKKFADLFQKSTNTERDALVKDYQKSLALTGDATKGKVVFEKNCASCHQLDGMGHAIGPNLAAMKNRGPDAILTNVLNPNAEVNPQFMNYICQTADGRVVSGMIASETSNSITFIKGDNKTETVLRIDVDQMRSTGVSLMPEGLEKTIDQQAMADLLSYLMQDRN